jgi:hypothetical protein
VPIQELLKKTPFNYLVIVSESPGSIRKGEVLQYQMKVESKAGGAKFKLQSGPTGMSISDTGLLTWKAPQKPDQSEEAVVVSVSDAADQERSQSFVLQIR